jgi:hypothetical protein
MTMKKRPLISRKEKKEMQEAGNARVDNHHAIVKAGKEREVYYRYPLTVSPTAGEELLALARATFKATEIKD